MPIRDYFESFFSFPTQFNAVEKKPLATTQFILTSLCICPTDDSTPPSKKRFNVVFTSIVVAIQFCGIFASLVYLLKFSSIDFEGSLFALLGFIGHTIFVYSFFTAFYLRHKIGGIFRHLTAFYSNSKQKAFVWISYSIFYQSNFTIHNKWCISTNRQKWRRCYNAVFDWSKSDKWMDLLDLF